MADGASPPAGDGPKKTGFNSVRSIWQERVQNVEGLPAPKFPGSGRAGSGRTSSGGAPPPSPSSRANVLLSQPQEVASDPFQQYGLQFAEDYSGVLTIRKVIPGSPADQTGAIFPGDALHEVNGLEVHKWPLERVTPLASGDRAGTTLRLAFERVGFSELINVELELGKNQTRPSPSPRMDPLVVPPPPLEQPAAELPSAGTVSPIEAPAQDYEEYQAVAPQSSLEDATDSKDEMRINVVKRYKSKIQELSQSLEESQVASYKQARQMEEMTRFLSEKDELLKELREAVSKLTNKLEESSRENYDLRSRISERGPADLTQNAAKGGDVANLNREVQRLTAELDAMRNQRDIAQLSSLPSDDASDMLRELKLQIIEKDAKIQDLEGKNASLKRSNVIQAVELQELHDHVAGMEKQKGIMQLQQFPPLPPLQSVHESPYETPMDEDDKMKAIMLADEVLQKAQEEIAVLKQKDERRMQLEVWAEQADHEIQRLRKELAEKQGSGEGATPDSMMRERDEHKAASQRAQTEIETLQVQLTRSKAQVDHLTQQLVSLDNLKAKMADLQKSKMQLEAQLQAVLSQQNGPSGPSAAGPVDGMEMPASILDHPLMQNLALLDKKQQELEQHVGNMCKTRDTGRSNGDEGAAKFDEQGQPENATFAVTEGATQHTASEAGKEAGTGAHTTQHFESVMQEKRNLEESLSRMHDERQFVERCLADARMDIGRLEMENESINSSFHQTQLAAAKLEGKLQAAQTRVSALENDLQKKKDEVQALNDELKRVRQNMMQSESEKGLELNTVRNELQYLKEENEKMKLESKQWSERMDQAAQEHQEQLAKREQELHRIASEKSGLTESFAAKESALTQKDHKLGVFADQLKAQKEKAAQAEAAAQRAEEELKRLRQEQDTERRNRLSRDSRSQALEERVLELQADLSAKEAELSQALCEKDEALAAIEAQGLELEHKIEQTETLRAVIRRLQEGSGAEAAAHSSNAVSPQSWGAGATVSSAGSFRPAPGAPGPGMRPGVHGVGTGGFQGDSPLAKTGAHGASPQPHAPMQPQSTPLPAQGWQGGTPVAIENLAPRTAGGQQWITRTSIM